MNMDNWYNLSALNHPAKRSDFRNGQGEPIPALFIGCELFTSCPSQRVELGPAADLGHSPFGTDPPALLDPVDRRVERALLDLKQLIRQMPNALDDDVAVERP